MKILIDGNEAISQAAIKAGCNFFAGYPITPATSILLHMSRELPKVGGIAIQGEDEIASFGFCIGAALSGRRVMTATSGPGISLYSESIGAAVMVEIPMVIIDVQRMGPSTGGPTIGSHGDIQFLRWGFSGGYPIIVLVPTTIPECYNLTMRAFDLSERFRCPVFVLTDKEIALTKMAVDTRSLEEYPVMDRLEIPQGNSVPFEPYRLKKDSDIPIIPPFGNQNLIRLTTSSHNSKGYLTKDPKSIGQHNKHLIEKIESNQDQINQVIYDKQPGAKILLISYGITSQSGREAVSIFRKGGGLISHLILHSIWPVPESDIYSALDEKSHVIIPELNQGLYSREIERLTNDQQKVICIPSLDGSLISPKKILETIDSL